ncbi:pyruvate dehydrogenase (acetyl-transferring) E1 component subunit alpha [bacterium]|nr:pyruvate dehydrogenase (acetyl-transferring) E1 component subunit alpha [bacterium]
MSPETGRAEAKSASPAESGPRKLLLDLYARMLLCRRFEEAAAKAYAQGKIGGFCHLYIGQEAVAVGAIATLGPDDRVVCTYRDHAHFLARGGDPKAAMAELLGRRAGCSSGLGGSMHMFDPARGFLGGWAIVGSHVPVGVGTAFAAKYREEKRVSLVFFGEGATAQGAFHEGMALAQLWKLPVVFVCENNHYAMGTPMEKEVPVEDLTNIALSYEMARDRLPETQDVLAVFEHIERAVERARRGEGPTFIECVTYRYRGHSMTDPAKYRTKEEVEEWKAKDSIPLARARLLSLGVAEGDLAAIDLAVEKKIEEAVLFAESEPEPSWEDATRNVYA